MSSQSFFNFQAPAGNSQYQDMFHSPRTMQQRNSSLQNEIHNMRLSYEALRNDYADLHVQNGEMSRRLSTLESEMKYEAGVPNRTERFHNGFNTQNWAELEKCRSELEKRDADIEALNNKIESRERENETLHNAQTATPSSQGMTRQMTRQQMKQGAKAQEKGRVQYIEELQKKIKSLNAKVEYDKLKIDNLSGQLGEPSQRKTSLEKKINTLKSRIEVSKLEMEQEISGLKRKLADADERNNSLEKEIKTLKEQVEAGNLEKEKEVADFTRVLGDAGQKHTALEMEIDRLKEQQENSSLEMVQHMIDHTSAVEEFTARETGLTEQVKSLRSQLVTSENVVKVQELCSTAKSEDIEALKSQAEGLTQEKHSLTEKSSQLQQDLDEAKQTLYFQVFEIEVLQEVKKEIEGRETQSEDKAVQTEDEQVSLESSTSSSELGSQSEEDTTSHTILDSQTTTSEQSEQEDQVNGAIDEDCDESIKPTATKTEVLGFIDNYFDTLKISSEITLWQTFPYNQSLFDGSDEVCGQGTEIVVKVKRSGLWRKFVRFLRL